MSEKGFLSNLFGGPIEVQIPAVSAPRPKAETSPFNVERAKQRQGKFPPQNQLFLDTARRDGHLSNVALATLIDPSGYTLDQVEALWNSGDISEKSTYVVLTQGLLPPRDVLRYEYSAEILNPTIPSRMRGPDGMEIAQYIEVGVSFSVTVPQGFRCYVFTSGPSLVEGRTLPDSLEEGRAHVQLCVQRETIGASKSDGSVDHTYGFVMRVAIWEGDFHAIPAGTLRFVARAEMIRA